MKDFFTVKSAYLMVRDLVMSGILANASTCGAYDPLCSFVEGIMEC